MSIAIGSILVKLIPEEHRWKLILFEKWDSIIGSLADRVKIEKIVDDTIVLCVAHPSWAQELFLLSNMLKKKINFYLNSERIKNIRFKTATFNSKEKTQIVTMLLPPSSKFPIKTPLPLGKLTKREQGVLEVISCDDLRSALELFFAQCKARTDQGGKDEKNKKSSVIVSRRHPFILKKGTMPKK